MKLDIINYTALAVKIQPDVIRILGAPVNLNTIVVAIKRFADSFEQKEEIREESILKNARLSLTDRVMDVKIPVNDFDSQNAISLMDKISKDYELFRFSGTFRFLTEDIEDIRQIFRRISDDSNLFNTGLAKIKVMVPKEQNRTDIVSYVAEILHASGIELVNAFFSQDYIILVLNENDASRAYDILHGEIAR
jgi:hypothetical protein